MELFPIHPLCFQPSVHFTAESDTKGQVLDDEWLEMGSP